MPAMAGPGVVGTAGAPLNGDGDFCGLSYLAAWGDQLDLQIFVSQNIALIGHHARGDIDGSPE